MIKKLIRFLFNEPLEGPHIWEKLKYLEVPGNSHLFVKGGALDRIIYINEKERNGSIQHYIPSFFLIGSQVDWSIEIRHNSILLYRYKNHTRNIFKRIVWWAYDGCYNK